MRNALPTTLTALFAALLLALPAATRADEPSPEPCPVKPASPELESLIGTWALSSFDGQDPDRAMAVQFMAQGKALVYVGAAEPVEAGYGVNCCGHLVLSPARTDVVPGLVAAYEQTDQTLTLFATDGDWVFTRIDTTTHGE